MSVTADIKKSEAALERETALKWAERAILCYRRGLLLRGENYRHEALEHAALVGDKGKFVGKIQRKIDAARPGRRGHGRF